ncbi:MAG: alanine racemase [Rubrivivax sp.]|nr:alanine racemase [Rubrivivax sp.]
MNPNAEHPPHTLADLETPVALLDLPQMERNIRHMQTAADALGVRLRPHVKTAKCVPVAVRQREAGGHGITVSTLKEADAFFEAGFDDILYAVGVVPNKLAHALALRQRGCRLQLIVDSLAAVQALVQAGRAAEHAFEVLIEVDVDGQRAGVPPDAELLLEMGRALLAGGQRLLGVMTHGGGSYGMRGAAALQAFAEQERSRCVQAAERLRAAGLPCEVVSVGSTPSALSARSAAGVTEIRAGVYVFHDLVMAGLGVCRPEDIALSVLCTVIGHQAHKGWVLVDAGWMALSRDRGTQGQPLDQGYGLVCREDGQPLMNWTVSAANQEHGIITARDGQMPPDLAERFPLGSRLRILPNHACATAAQFSEYLVLGPEGPQARWPRFGGW